MNLPLPFILYCHCAYAEILSPATKDAVLAGLAESGLPFRTVPDLCELAARRDPSLKALVDAAAPLHVIACHPRAVRWLFAVAGAPLPASTVFHNMRTDSADAILDKLKGGKSAIDVRGESPHPPRDPSNPAFPPKNLGDWIPWFPVIDYDRCADCGQCLEFCLFGAYAADADRKVRVVHPEKCKTNCPACARVCPHSAIIFPKFKDGPISGDEGTLTSSFESGVKADLGGLSKDQVMNLLRRRDDARARAERERTAARHRPDAQEPPAR